MDEKGICPPPMQATSGFASPIGKRFSKKVQFFFANRLLQKGNALYIIVGVIFTDFTNHIIIFIKEQYNEADYGQGTLGITGL